MKIIPVHVVLGTFPDADRDRKKDQPQPETQEMAAVLTGGVAVASAGAPM